MIAVISIHGYKNFTFKGKFKIILFKGTIFIKKITSSFFVAFEIVYLRVRRKINAAYKKNRIRYLLCGFKRQKA